MFLVLATAASAQGILTVVPTTAVSTTAGTGVVGNTGNGTAATAATLADPSGVAYDAQGNLYLADAQNHVIREVSKTSGVITVIAGTGIEGYGGDGGLECPAFFEPVALIETGIQGANDGTTEEAYA